LGKRVRKGIVYKNLDKLILSAQQSAIKEREICCTISLYNVMRSVEIFDELYERYVGTELVTSLFLNPTIDPEFCAVKNLPFKLKSKILKDINAYLNKCDGEKKGVLERSIHNLTATIKQKQNKSEWLNFVRFCKTEEFNLNLESIVKLIPEYQEYFEKEMGEVITVREV
jgi:hypothetical protein